MPRRRNAYRCEAIARDLNGTYEATLATYRAATPRLAARWARTTARRYAELLALAPTTPCLVGAPLVQVPADGPRPDVELHAWADSTERFEAALRDLAEGRVVTFTVDDFNARYELRVDPVPTRRRPRRLPRPFSAVFPWQTWADSACAAASTHAP